MGMSISDQVIIFDDPSGRLLTGAGLRYTVSLMPGFIDAPAP